MREEGTLTQWDDAKGYGFITPDGGGPRLFVHLKAFTLRAGRPREGERLSFEAGQDAQGKPRALKVRGQAVVATPAPAARGSGQVWLVPVFAAFFLLVHLLRPLPPALWGVYMAMSLATFIVYAGDKRAARRGQWRVSENTLHALALFCGWPGALLARQLLRHKTGKPGFTRVFWATVALNWLAFTVLAVLR